jgi:hypothetical protein
MFLPIDQCAESHHPFMSVRVEKSMLWKAVVALQNERFSAEARDCGLQTQQEEILDEPLRERIWSDRVQTLWQYVARRTLAPDSGRRWEELSEVVTGHGGVGSPLSSSEEEVERRLDDVLLRTLLDLANTLRA